MMVTITISEALTYTHMFSTLLLFYGYIIPLIGAQLREVCSSHPYCRYQWRKSSWGYFVDLSDGQWREFRSSLPLLIAAAIGGVVLHKLVLYLSRAYGDFQGSYRFRTLFHAVFGVLVVMVQHGYQSLIVLTLIALAYTVAKLLGSYQNAYWGIGAFAIIVLLLKESYRISHRVDWLHILFDKRYSGMYSWHVPANFLVLRLVSFMLDYHWAYLAAKNTKKNEDAVPKKNQEIQISSYGHHALHEYNFVNCLSYCVYAPLYIAGPVITFNAYLNYSKAPQVSESVLMYGLRWALSFFLMELGISCLPCFAIVNTGLYRELNAPQLAILAYCTLKLMWLKFLLIWRFFRLWSMADGVLPPENQVRCMSNNQSIGQFWKGWHASFNLWIVRYMYIPLGGRKMAWLNVWPIFLFVAVWHDIEPKLLLWGALNSIFYVIEIAGRKIGNSSSVKAMPENLRQFLETISSALFIMVLIGVNMTGYAVGGNGVGFILTKLLSSEGFKTIFWSFYFLSSGVCIMNFLRKHGYSS